MTDLRKLTEAAASCECLVCRGEGGSGSAPFYATPYCDARRHYRDAASPDVVLTLMNDPLKWARGQVAAELDALTAENKALKTELGSALEVLTDIGGEQRMAEFEALKKEYGRD